jgi:hypothetical protein
MKWKTIAIVWAILFLAGFLLGFIPKYQRASKLAKQLETARLESKLRDQLSCLKGFGHWSLSRGLR